MGAAVVLGVSGVTVVGEGAGVVFGAAVGSGAEEGVVLMWLGKL